MSAKNGNSKGEFVDVLRSPNELFVIGCVKSSSEFKGDDGIYNSFLDLSNGLGLMALGVRSKELPITGQVLCFLLKSKATKSGKFMIKRFGWLSTSGKADINTDTDFNEKVRIFWGAELGVDESTIEGISRPVEFVV